MQIKYKDPDSTVDYEFDWAAPPPAGPYLIGGDTIVTSTFLLDNPPDNLLTIGATAKTATTTTVWLSGGGVDGTMYVLTNHITTQSGRTDDWSVKIKIRER